MNNIHRPSPSIGSFIDFFNVVDSSDLSWYDYYSNNNKSRVCCAPVRDASLSLPLRLRRLLQLEVLQSNS